MRIHAATEGTAVHPDLTASMNIHFSRFLSYDFLKFCVIGGTSAAAAVGLLYVAVDILRVGYLPAFAVIFVLINVYAYAASRRFAFKNTSVGLRSGLARYFAVSGLSLVFNSILLVTLVEIVGLGPVAASALIGVANAPLNFILHRKVTFGIRSRVAKAKRDPTICN